MTVNNPAAEAEREREHAALGRLVHNARDLEHHGYLLARALGVHDPERMNIGAALKEARRQARQGLPPWSRNVTLAEIDAHVAEALTVIQHRNRHVHWQRFERVEGGEWVRYQRSLRGATEQQFAVSDVERWAERARAASRESLRLLLCLLFEVRSNIYHWHPRLGRPGEEWSPIAFVPEEGEPRIRPSDEELTVWYSTLTREWPREWAVWPLVRYARQALRARLNRVATSIDSRRSLADG